MSVTTANSRTGDSKDAPSTTVLHASFNYYSAPATPRLNDISLLIGGSTDISPKSLLVTDLRSLPKPLSSYNHETHGFQIFHQELPIDGSHESVHDDKVMSSQYYPAMIALLKKELGIRSAAMVNHTLRDIPTAAFFVSHADYTAGGSRAHLRSITSEWFEESQTEEERAKFFSLRAEIIAAEDSAMAKAGLNPRDCDILTGKGGHWDWDGTGYEGPRYAIFSVWRPWETVQRDPLALLGSPESDLQYAILPRMYKDRAGYVKEYYSENPILKPPPVEEEGKHKWLYLSQQKPEEVYAIKLYDSEALKKGDGSVRLFCPHSAFQLEGTEDLPPRRSSELRVWCIW